MDVKYVNPFISAFINVMPQLGINDLKKGNLSVKEKYVKSPGVLINVGIVGDFKGNIIYGTSIECAKKIASAMMMGMEIKEFDAMAQSALSELSNMLTANASTTFSKNSIMIDISTPTMIYGDSTAATNADKVICVEMRVCNLPFEINVAIDNIA